MVQVPRFVNWFGNKKGVETVETKALAALIIGAVIFGCGLIGGLLIQTYLGTRSSTQTLPLTLENLTVKSYTPRLLTKFAVEFVLENNGTNDIQIIDVKLNGFSNQTTSGMNEGWNGTTFLHPKQTGSLYVYAPSYAYVINQTMPQLHANPTYTEMENLETWMYSYNSTFTFVTNTGHEYNCTVPGLGFGLVYAIETMAARSTQYTFMGTEQLIVQGIAWNWASKQFTLYVNNTGTKDVTITQILVNYGTAGVTQPTTLPYILKATKSQQFAVTYAYTNGTNYDISVVTSDGYKFTNTFQGGVNAGVETEITSQVGVLLKEDAINWQTGKIVIYVRNTGTSDATIDAVYIGTSGNLTLQTGVTFNPSSKIVSKNGGTIAITVTYSWGSKTTYYFRIAPVVGEALVFQETAP